MYIIVQYLCTFCRVKKWCCLSARVVITVQMRKAGGANISLVGKTGRTKGRRRCGARDLRARAMPTAAMEPLDWNRTTGEKQTASRRE